ncbi:MAG: hypothetical protein ACOX3Q_08015 [Clostridia bacterium]|nr:hypothetical protein [Clostridiaceae bacterium]
MKRYIQILIPILLTVLLFSACKKTDSFSEADLEFTVNGKVFTLDSDAALLLEELGEPEEVQEAPSCLYEGMDKVYTYKGVEIYTYPYEGKDLIDEIFITDSAYETKRGIKVGDTKEDLIKAYGEDYVDEGGIYRYALKKGDLDSPCIYFTIDNDIITGISLYSASNIS